MISSVFSGTTVVHVNVGVASPVTRAKPRPEKVLSGGCRHPDIIPHKQVTVIEVGKAARESLVIRQA